MEGEYVRCLMVETGEENTVLQLLRVLGLGRGIYPQRIRVRKIRQVWRKDRIRLLPALNIPWNLLKEAIAVLKELCAEIKG